MKVMITLIVLLFSVTTNAATVSFFDSKPLFLEPYAAPRSPDTGIVINTFKYKTSRLGYLEASLGHNVPIITLKLDNLRFQTGLIAGFWASLGYDDGAFPLLMQDFLLSVPVEFKWYNFTGRLSYDHISAHKGDGLDRILEKTLSKKDKREYNRAEKLLDFYAKNEDLGLTLKKPLNYSRDFITLNVAYDSNIGKLDARSYCKIGYAHRMFPKSIKRWFIGNGFEVVYPSNSFAPYFGQDITYNQDTDSVDWSSEMGAIVLSGKTDYFNLRIAATMFIGKDRRGQLFGTKLKTLGIGFFIY